VFGHGDVRDLIGGRAAWTALGMPTEGQVGDARRIAQYVQPARTVRIDATIADVIALGDLRYAVPVLGPDDVVLGAVQPSARALPPSTRVEDAMNPAPGTIRPDVRVDDVAEQLRADHLDHVLVTTVSGVILGIVVREELHV
jgi:predicted transcriptional regulator